MARSQLSQQPAFPGNQFIPGKKLASYSEKEPYKQKLDTENPNVKYIQIHVYMYIYTKTIKDS